MRLLLLLAFLLVARGAAAVENPYDVLGKVLSPYAQLLAGTRPEGRAMVAELRVEKTGDEHSALRGSRVQVWVEMPERLRVTALYAGEPVTICRDGEKVWASPGSRLKALLADPAVQRQLPEAEPGFKLRPFELPIPEKQLAFLPVLFQVQDAGTQAVEGLPCRMLDVQLQKALGNALEVEKSTARLWVDGEHRLVRLAWQGERGDATLRLEKVQFKSSLPAETWTPTLAQAADLMKVPAKVYDQILRALMGRGSNVK